MALDPDALPATSFPTVRRGADPDAVKRLLTTVAEELRQLRSDEVALRAAAAAARVEPPPPPPLDEAQVAELLGPETARVLSAAREAAAEIRAKAAERAERLERDAEAEAARVRADADATAARRREQADADVDAARAEAAGVRADAEADAQRRREEADAEVEARRVEADALVAAAAADVERRREEADAEVEARRVEGDALVAAAAADVERRGREADDALEVRRQEAAAAEALAAAAAERRRAEAEALVEAGRLEAAALVAEAEQAGRDVIEQAKAEGRKLVIDAQAVRERVLADMERRRVQTRSQIAGLVAGRDRIVAALGFVRVGLDEVDEELRVAVEETEELLEEDAASASTGSAAGSMALGELEDTGGRDDVISRLQERAGVPSSDLPATQAVPVVPVVVIDEDDEDEAEVAEPVDTEPDTVADTTTASAVPLAEPEPEPVADEPEPEPESVADEAEPEHGSVADEPTSAADEAGAEEVVTSEEPAAALAAEGRPIASGPAAPAVEALFARIRASRAEVVAKAQAVLDAGGSEGDEAEDVDVDPARSWVRERATVLDPIERDVARRLKRALADEESAMLDVLRRQRRAQVDELVGSPEAHAERVRAGVREQLVEAVAAGEAFSRSLSDAVRAVEAGALLDPVLDELVADLVSPLRARVSTAVSETGGSTEDLAAPLRAAYREWKVQRLDRAASHAALSAFGAGALEALVPGTPVRWAVEPAEGACPDGEDNALAGVVGAGEAFPTGNRHAPAHSTCRCQVVPADRQ